MFSETFECLIDNLPGQHLTYGKHDRGNQGIEDFDFRISESRVCNNLSKICFQSFSSDSISWCRNRLPLYESIPSVTKKGIDYFAIPGSFEPIRCLIKANNSTHRLYFLNSNSCSSSTFAVPIFTMLASSKVRQKANFSMYG